MDLRGKAIWMACLRREERVCLRLGIGLLLLFIKMTEEDKTQQVEEEQKEESTLETAIQAVIKQAIINQGRTLE